MTGWSLDLGTTNSGIARCDETGQPQIVELPGVCRDPERDDETGRLNGRALFGGRNGLPRP